ncbi:unnamed protein product [Anisakis simplex]|uniref:Transmembrane protein 188 n=1 Tax=Anisakis simplex TaxID=6269 RepID=A0A158PNH7_ANISI|nr:unnamed protein product [Anisakis simplex]
MDAGPSVRYPSTFPTVRSERWHISPYRRESFNSIDTQRISPDSYEEVKKLILLAGIFFMVAILFFLMKLEVPIDDVFKWSPIVWLIGVLICCLLLNFLCFCRKLYKRRQLARLRRQQELLLSLNLATSFPCLAPPPHDAQCCGGNRLLWPNFRRTSTTSLPSYTQALRTSVPLKDSMAELRNAEEANAPSANQIEDDKPPPPYDEALKMLRNK